MIAAFFWAFQGRALKAHFGADELMNMYGYWQPPLWKVLLANLSFWSNFVRPMAAVYYLPLFHLFKLDPVAYTWVRIGLLGLNTVLFYKLALQISRSWWVSALASFPVAYQANLGNLSFDGAFIYDTLCATFYFAALLYYIRRRKRGTHLTAGQGCVFLALYICALDSKEMAVSLPVVVLAYELLFQKPRKACKESGQPGETTLARTHLALGVITVIFILGKSAGRAKSHQHGSVPPRHHLGSLLGIEHAVLQYDFLHRRAHDGTRSYDVGVIAGRWDSWTRAPPPRPALAVPVDLGDGDATADRVSTRTRRRAAVSCSGGMGPGGGDVVPVGVLASGAGTVRRTSGADDPAKRRKKSWA